MIYFPLPRSLISFLLPGLQQLAGSCGESLLLPGCKAPRLQSPVVGRLRKPSPQFSPPSGVSQGFWLYQGSGAPVLDTTPRTFHNAQGPSRTYHCLDWCERWAHNPLLGFLYPPTQVSTATSQGCLYSCDACTLRAVHLLSQPQLRIQLCPTKKRKCHTNPMFFLFGEVLVKGGRDYTCSCLNMMMNFWACDGQP